MSFEQLKPPQCAQELEERLADLTKLLQSIQKNQRDLPPGHLKIAQKKSHVEYYHITEQGDTKGHYISVKEKSFAARLAQKDYDERILACAAAELQTIQMFEQTYPSFQVEDVYEQMSALRQHLIDPIEEPVADYVKEWRALEYAGNPYSDGSSLLTAEDGTQVRSKSELLICDILNRESIPYRYECPLYLEGQGTVYPDFTVLDVKNRREIYWEHMGIMDDVEYANKAIRKISSYIMNGFFPGEDLIITYETKETPIDMRTIKAIVKHYFL